MRSRFEVPPVPVALTVAGSDSSGGAGIQADLKTFTRLGVYGMSVITAITAQNSLGASIVTELKATAVAAQMKAVLEDIPPASTKVGMLSNAANVRTVVSLVNRFRIPLLVLDPVMRSTSGTSLLDDAGIEAMRAELLPLADLVTPNLDEAEVLTGEPVRTVDQMVEAARQIHGMGARNVMLTGGHLDGSRVVDVFFDGTSIFRLVGDRIDDPNSRGTGCVLSAAVTAHLARGVDLESAVSRAQVLTRRAIERGLRLGRGSGPCDPVGIDPL